MNRKRPFLATVGCATLVLALPSLALAATVWSEPVDGDLSTDNSSATMLGTLSPGSSSVVLDDSGATFDRDYFTFTVPTGQVLDKFLLSDYTSTSYSYIAIRLETGTVPFAGSEVETILWNSADLDLLLFDSAPGPQPAGDYVVSLNYVDSSYVDFSLVTTAVLAPSVPEPSAFAQSFFGLLSLIMIGWRIHKRASGLTPPSQSDSLKLLQCFWTTIAA